jgi:hypothetical protein
MIRTRLALCLAFYSTSLISQTTAPKDVQPGSITYDDVPYPYPVQ